MEIKHIHEVVKMLEIGEELTVRIPAWQNADTIGRELAQAAQARDFLSRSSGVIKFICTDRGNGFVSICRTA